MKGMVYSMNEIIKESIWGAIVGDAMGVPFEWKKMEEITPPLELTEDTRRGLPAGTWSDDSSMILCTLESLLDNGRNMKAIGDSFVSRWYDNPHWTPTGRIFDMGNTTRYAMECIKNGEYANGLCERDKGNGSLMRILPLALYMYNKDIKEIKETIENCSALTHGTLECKIACVWYSLLVREILKSGKDGWGLPIGIDISIINNVEEQIRNLYAEEDLKPFERVLCHDMLMLAPKRLNNTGYVVHSLEVVINCLFNSSSFIMGIQRAISIGGDTDTNASLVGGILALMYEIPEELKDGIVKKEQIEELLERVDWK